MKKLSLLTALFLITFLALTFHITTAVAAETPKYGGTLRIIWENSPGAFGYPPAVFGDSSNGSQFAFDTLLHEVNGEIIPWLAESYEVADNLKSVTFKLRKGVKFHDGTDFNAEAAKWNLDNQIANKRQPYWESIDIIDDYTVKVNLKAWRNFILSYFCDSPDSWMASPTAFKKHGVDWMRLNPVGTGPFKFVSFTRDVNLLVERNPDYWLKGRPYLDAIDSLFIADPTTKLNFMKTGGADMILAEPGKRAADLEAAGFPLENLLVVNFLLIPDTANDDSIFADKRVREAIEYGIDREAIAKGLSYGYWKATYQVPAEDTMAYNPNFTLGRRYNVEKAKKLLVEAGYPQGFKTTIISAPAGRNKDVCTAVQAYLSKIGIQAEMEYPDQPKYLKYQLGSYHNALIIQPVGGYINNDKSIQFFLSPTSPRFKSWARPPEFSRIFNISSARRTPDVELMRAYHDELIKAAAVIPVASGGKLWGVQPYVKDLGLNTKTMPNYFNHEQAWLDK